MASQQSTVDLIVEQMSGSGPVSARKMFGEYAIFRDGKMVALVCDDQLFVKPTEAGRAHIGAVVEAPPYRSAKPCFLIDADQWDDREWMTQLVRLTAAELPLPKPKPKRKGPAAARPREKG